MLSRFFCGLLLWAGTLSPAFAQGKLTGSTLLASYTTSEIQDLLVDLGIPPIFLAPQYPVDIYRITYLTPYRHPDSLVQASGMVVLPRGSEEQIPCGLPLAAYGHGTAAGHTDVPSFNLNDAQALVNIAFSSTGYLCIAPDYLGLGEYDERVLIHPYQHAFSQANTTINMIRATRHFMDSLSVVLNGQVYLHGYSQGGFTAVAALREIETNYPFEFNVVASAPMSGAYDMGGAQADLIGSDDPYPTPGYLPFIILAYQDQYEGILFNEFSDIFVAPYDTLLPPLFYAKNTSIGTLNELSTPVPKDMMQDSVISNFYSDPNHRFRRLLELNDMLDWAPQSPVRLLYCTGDDQVSYLNSENAYARWNELGAPSITKNDFGLFNHNDCALFCFLDAKDFFDAVEKCPLSGVESVRYADLHVYPNPVNTSALFTTPEWMIGETYEVTDVRGRVMTTGLVNGSSTLVDFSSLAAGVYVLRVGVGRGVRVVKQ
jgi:hypothetical protein